MPASRFPWRGAVVRRPFVAHRPSELQFTERMSGTWDHPRDPRLSFVSTLQWPSLAALLADPATPARSIGTLEAPALSPYPLTVVHGHFQLLGPMRDGERRMIHRLAVRDREGSTWFVDGQGEVLGVLVDGKSNKEIGVELDCAEATVEQHVMQILERSGTPSRTILIARFWTEF